MHRLIEAAPTLRWRALHVMRPLSLVAASVALLWPGTSLGPSIDAAVYVLAGSRVRDGIMPYRGLWDSKPPGSFVLNALGQALLPWLEPWLVSWLLTVVFTGTAILLIYDLLCRHLSAGASWGWSLVGCVAMACYPVASGGGLTESFAVLPIVAALWGIAVCFVYALRRVDCRSCGVTVERVPWARGKCHLTISYRWFLARWAKRLSWDEVARIFHTNWRNVFESVKHAVFWGFVHRKPTLPLFSS